jgi:hypothetical protein
MNQPDLFGDAPAQYHSPTSRAAAASIGKAMPHLRERVYLAIVKAGERGLTDEELQGTLAMNPNTQRPRRIELYQQRMIRMANFTRPTASGRQAAVWVVARA